MNNSVFAFGIVALTMALAVVVLAIEEPNPPFVPVSRASQEAASPSGVDLDVIFISRAPLYKVCCVA